MSHQAPLPLDSISRSLPRDAGDTGDLGLAPRQAESWLRLHHAFALRPEHIAVQLEAGMEPAQILRATAKRGGASAKEACATGSTWDFERDVSRLESLAARVVPRPDRGYPERLRALVDAPCVLLVRGRVESLAMGGVAIVGARAATQAARQTARRLARELAAGGLTIISGLARGIDAAAHRGALEAGGRTIAVLACGPDRIYPPEHRELAREICESGAVVSEMPLGAPPRRAHFPLRNRLISGLSLGVIVVEARRRSGSLITVRHALDQGRDVFVVPGAVEGPFAEGTNALLRDGARPVLCARDVFEDLGLDAPCGNGAGSRRADRAGSAAVNPTSVARASELPDSAAALILALLEDGPLSRDIIAERSGLGPGSLSRALLELELADRVVSDRDGRLQRKWT
jgi:DNA processing protein